MKEVAHARKHDHQPRLWGQGLHPIDDGRRIDDFVRVSLNHEPGTSRSGKPGYVEEPDRRRDGDQVTRRALLRQAQRDVAAEGKSGYHQRTAGPAARSEGGDGFRIRRFARALVEYPVARADTAEIEAQRRNAGFAASARATVVTTLLSMVPPFKGCGWQTIA